MESSIDMVDGLLQSHISLSLSVVEEYGLRCGVGCDVVEDDACSLVGIGFPKGSECVEHVCSHLGGDSGWHG